MVKLGLPVHAAQEGALIPNMRANHRNLAMHTTGRPCCTYMKEWKSSTLAANAVAFVKDLMTLESPYESFEMVLKFIDILVGAWYV